MKRTKGDFDHLLNNIEKGSYKNSIFNYRSGRKAFLSLGKGNVREWLEKLLPNTRLIIEPKIIGLSIGIQYINGKLNKVINENCLDISRKINSIISVPKRIPIKARIEIRGVLYDVENASSTNSKTELMDTQKILSKKNEQGFCAFHLYHSKINQFQALKELRKLNLEIPDTQFTNFTSDIEIYRECWRQGKLFQRYPTSGIVLKINSNKLQKQLGDNNLSINWAYAIN